MELAYLHNPDNIQAVLTTNDGYVTLRDNQGFQTSKNKVELWEKLEDGRLVKVKGWTTTIIARYY